MILRWLAARRRKRDYWAVLAPFQDALDLQAAPQSVQRQFERLPEPVAHLLAAHLLATEVRSGGFAQYFASQAAALAPEAEHAFHALGLPEAARIIASALRIVGDPYPRVGEARKRILEGVHDRTPDSLILRESLEERSKAFRKSLGGAALRRFTKAANVCARHLSEG